MTWERRGGYNNVRKGREGWEGLFGSNIWRVVHSAPEKIVN